MGYLGEGSGGPRYGWGAPRGMPGTSFERGTWQGAAYRPRNAPPESGVRRAEWQWRGHGPSSWSADYDFEHRGGAGRDAPVFRTEASMGPRSSQEMRMAHERARAYERARRNGGEYLGYAGERGRGGYDRGYGGGHAARPQGDGRASLHPAHNKWLSYAPFRGGTGQARREAYDRDHGHTRDGWRRYPGGREW